MSSKKKALIITYYWPPVGGSGVQRWLKFVKYLRDFDIEPIIYTVKNPSYPILDDSLLSEIPEGIEILKQKIFEPNSLLSIFGSKSKNESAGFLDPNPSFLGKIMQYIRANYFIPDARKYWIKPSVRFLSNYIEKNAVDVVITSGPPHSLQLIGLQLKKQKGVKWISDFRDPWTEIDYFHQLPLTKKATKKHHILEEEVIRKSDMILVVGDTMKKNFLKYSDSIEVITNGFDTNEKTSIHVLDNKFSITHVGLMNDDRNPNVLWQALKELCDSNTDFNNNLKIRLIGKVANSIVQNLSMFEASTIELIPYLKHEEVSKYQSTSQVLLLCINNVPSAKGIITGKIFEYLQSKRPILAIGPENGDASVILKNTNAGCIFDFNEKEKLKAYILSLYKQYKVSSLVVESKNIEQYHRRNLTEKLANVINNITQN
tara:strand:- start:869 stop:2158 length:1290 start_codon:yes stop_codon:yes gene_type:complete